MNDTIKLVARVLLAAIFIIAGVQKISGYEGTAGWMSSMGVPGALLPLVILLEIGGGLALLLGVLSRWAALALAAFTLLAGLIFHFDFADQTQSIMFMKNLAIAGGLLMVYAAGPGAYAMRQG
ncbi:MAG: DoxX family protein [Hyphomicrobiaceae bacterium]|jgi:putative oxidoreductase